jgi:hypothetical protein
MPHVVYVLVDPRTDAIRYVGYTNDPERRLRAHMKPSGLRGHAHRENWLRSLRAEGVWPDLVVIAQRQTHEDIQEAEREAIARLRVAGHDLTNGTPGGDGGPTTKGRTPTAEEVSRRVATRRGYRHSEETRRLISERTMGRGRGVPLSPEHRAKIGAASRGHQKTQQQLTRQSVSMTGKKAGWRWRVVDGKRVWFPPD